MKRATWNGVVLAESDATVVVEGNHYFPPESLRREAFDASAPCGPLAPASEIGHPSKGRITLKVNGTVKQDGDLNQMIWSVPETIWKLSEMVELAAGDIIMTGTPAGVGALAVGDKIECTVEGVGSLTVSIGKPKVG